MSGGFFRGTSADQDTRFSNKQAKLLKTQKFAPELEQLVDITKVKMDVMRPWIATRVTDFLGFEDEVLINFIYGLLDGKVVDGRQIQIQLTGFMEKNTGKFMKELWNLLLSAQKNASGVPQQFLDSKEEEMRKKKVETDKLTQEIQRRKERGGWGPEPDRKTRMDDREAKEVQRGANAPTEMKQSAEDDLAGRTKDFLEPDGERSSRRKKRSSPAQFSDVSPSSPRRRRSLPDKSPSRSPLIRRSYSGESCKSRSVSVSPQRQRRSVSRERQFPSPRRHQTAPRQPRLHPHRQSPHARQRSTSRSRHRSPSLPRLRSPIRRRSRSPVRHRARSPIHHKSPSPRYRRSRSPRRRSPVYVRRQSPSPLNRRSPVRRRSPLRHASPSPQRRTSPPIRPQRSQKSPMPSLRRSDSPRKSRSPLHRLHRSPVKGNIDSAKKMELRRTRDDNKSHISPARHQSEREHAERAGLGSKRGNHAARRMSPTSKSPQHVASNRHDTVNSVAAKFVSENPLAPVNGRDRQARQRGISSLSSPARDQETTHFPEEIEYGPGRLEDETPVVDFSREDWELARGGASPRGKRRQYEKNSVKGSSADKHEINRDGSYSHSQKSRKTGEKNLDAIVGPNCEDDRKYKSHTTERRAPKVGDKDSSSDEAGYDSQEDLKDRKRRRKDEKRLRKEEKRRKREERHRRREERRTSKQKSKYPDDGTSSDYDEQNDKVVDHFDDDAGMALKLSDNEETESEQKKLEIQLREKALESLRAKKAITN